MPSGIVANPSGSLTELRLITVAVMDVTFGSLPPVARLLLLASRWFDNRSLDELERRGWPRLSPAQSLVFAFLEVDGVSPAELARRLGQSRQATHELVNGLCRLGLLDLQHDPDRRGGRLVLLTDRGLEFAVAGYEVLRGLEEQFGTERAARLRDLLADFDSFPGRGGGAG